MNPDKFNQTIKWGILLLAVSLIFSLAISQAIVVLLVLVWIVKLIVTKKSTFKINPFLYPFLAFIAARIISVFFSVDFSTSAQIFNKEIFFYLLFFIFVDSFPINDRKFIKQFVYILIIAAVAASIIGIMKVLLGAEERASSTTSGYSTLGMFLTVIFGVVIALGNNKDFFPKKILWLSCIAILVAGVLFTFNRTHWGIVAFIFVLIGFMRERKALLIIAAAAAILIAVIPSLRERFYELIFFTQNLSDRNILWDGAFSIFFKHPIFGFGPRTFREIFPLFSQLADKGISSWHCDYLQVYMGSGILGFLSFIWLEVSIYYYSFKLLRSKKLESFYKDLTLSIVLGMTAFYLTAIVGGFIFDPISSLLYLMLLGFLALIVLMEKGIIVSDMK